MRRAIGELTVQNAVCRLARQYLNAAIDARKRLKGSPDAEALHDLRVALRRLRSCLRAYAPYVVGMIPAKLTKHLHALARETNAAREAEVQLAWLHANGKGLDGSERPGRRWLRARLVLQKNLGYSHVCGETLAEFDKVTRKFRAALTVACAKHVSRGAPRQTSFIAAAARQIDQYAAVLWQELGVIRSAKDDAAIHAARITGKRLRYLLEPLVPAGELIETLKAFQDQLGELHDRNVLRSEIVESLAKVSAHRACHGVRHDPRPGLKRLAQRNNRDATKLYNEILQLYLGRRRRNLIRPIRDLVRQLESPGRKSTSHDHRA